MTVDGIVTLLPLEAWYIVLVLGLFVVPSIVQRLRIPAAITALALGALAGMGAGMFHEDNTVQLLATFGIVSLFLLAGLEVDLIELRRSTGQILRHLAVGLGLLVAGTWALQSVFGLSLQASAIMALAALTPSVGFILSSLHRFGFSAEDERQVKMQAISSELLALVLLFLCVQSESLDRLAINGAALILIILLLPVVFWVVGRHIVPYAPRSEFAFLVVIAIVCAWTTRKLGAYYLLGAFIAGLIAQRTRSYLPGFVSQKVVNALELFASFFIPFYFFSAGLELRREDFSLGALAIAACMLAVFLPLRVGQVVLLRRRRLGRPAAADLRIAVALLPTLVFTLVLAGILRDQFHLPSELYGALIIYTMADTLVPSMLLSAPTPDFTSPEVELQESGPWPIVPPPATGVPGAITAGAPGGTKT